MLLMVACGALLAVAVVAAWRWRGYRMELPEWATENDGDLATAGRALAWLFAVALLTGLLVAVLVIGPAGRLAMRLLASTSPDAQGRLTEAGEVIGDISLGGTIAFFVFVGLPFGLAVGLAYALATFVLPRGVVGGALFGAALLVVFGSTADPLREENPDFEIVGPGWLSVATFVAMALLTGALTAPIAGRVAAAVGKPRVWWLIWMLPVGLVALGSLVLAPAALVVFFVGCLVFVIALLVSPEQRDVVWRRGKRVLQALLAAAVAVTTPGFVSALSSIVE
jgi:hypothetical protein